MGVFDQSEFQIRCEWGIEGVKCLAPISDVVIIVDVVDIGVSRGAKIYPYKFKDDSAVEYAKSLGAELAGARNQPGKYSLSPKSLASIRSGEGLVLPSPNGSTLTIATGLTPTLAGCFRNASSVAKAAKSLGKKISVIPAGERWKEDDSLRPSIEDLLGAGAIIYALGGGLLSPEAQIARDAFVSVKDRIGALIHTCSSGKELVEKGHGDDVELACALDVSKTVPVIRGNVYVQL
jgi:2-phosphosulfolactate phosphatase